MSKKWLLFVVAICVASPVFAQVTPSLAEGTKVIEGSGSLDLMSDKVEIQLAYGKLVTDQIEVAAVAGLTDNDLYMRTELGVRADYNFSRASAFVPFLSTGAIWTNVEADDSDIDANAAVFPLGGGFKYFIRDDIALAVNGSYLLATDDIYIDSEDDEVQSDEFRILLGVRHYFN